MNNTNLDDNKEKRSISLLEKVQKQCNEELPNYSLVNPQSVNNNSTTDEHSFDDLEDAIISTTQYLMERENIALMLTKKR